MQLCPGVTKVEEKTEAEASNAACVKELRAYASSQLEVLGAAACRPHLFRGKRRRHWCSKDSEACHRID